MRSFLFIRAQTVLLSLLIAVTITFAVLRVIPGDAVTDTLTRSGASPSLIAERRAALRLDQAWWVQYGQLIGGLLRGDLGLSLMSGRPVAEMLGEQFGATVVLAAGALVIAVVLGVGGGAILALAEPGPLRNTASVLASLSLASPVYWTGTLAIYLCSVQLRWLPSTGSGVSLRHLLLPWLVLGFSISGSIARVTAASLADVRKADFIRTARAKGLRERLVLLRHTLRPAITSVVAIIALQAGFLLGGAVVTEMLFVRQGMGQVMMRAVYERDFTVVQGAVIVSALLYSLASAAADLIAVWLDPRVRFTLLPDRL
jgi:peptide/nickel transport system permease protein